MRHSLSCMELRPVTGQSPPLRSAPLSRHPCGNSSFLHHSSHYCCRHTTTAHLEAVTGHPPRRHPSHLVAIHSMREGRPRETPTARTPLQPSKPSTHPLHRQSCLRRWSKVRSHARRSQQKPGVHVLTSSRRQGGTVAECQRLEASGREPSSPQTSVPGIEAMSRIVGGISHEMPVTSHHWASNAQRFWLGGIAELTHIKCQSAIYALYPRHFSL